MKKVGNPEMERLVNSRVPSMPIQLKPSVPTPVKSGPSVPIVPSIPSVPKPVMPSAPNKPIDTDKTVQKLPEQVPNDFGTSNADLQWNPLDGIGGISNAKELEGPVNPATTDAFKELTKEPIYGPGTENPNKPIPNSDISFLDKYGKGILIATCTFFGVALVVKIINQGTIKNLINSFTTADYSLLFRAFPKANTAYVVDTDGRILNVINNSNVGTSGQGFTGSIGQKLDLGNVTGGITSNINEALKGSAQIGTELGKGIGNSLTEATKAIGSTGKDILTTGAKGAFSITGDSLRSVGRLADDIVRSDTSTAEKKLLPTMAVKLVKRLKEMSPELEPYEKLMAVTADHSLENLFEAEQEVERQITDSEGLISDEEMEALKELRDNLKKVLAKRRTSRILEEIKDSKEEAVNYISVEHILNKYHIDFEPEDIQKIIKNYGQNLMPGRDLRDSTIDFLKSKVSYFVWRFMTILATKDPDMTLEQIIGHVMAAVDSYKTGNTIMSIHSETERKLLQDYLRSTFGLHIDLSKKDPNIQTEQEDEESDSDHSEDEDEDDQGPNHRFKNLIQSGKALPSKYNDPKISKKSDKLIRNRLLPALRDTQVSDDDLAQRINRLRPYTDITAILIPRGGSQARQDVFDQAYHDNVQQEDFFNKLKRKALKEMPKDIEKALQKRRESVQSETSSIGDNVATASTSTIKSPGSRRGSVHFAGDYEFPQFSEEDRIRGLEHQSNLEEQRKLQEENQKKEADRRRVQAIVDKWNAYVADNGIVTEDKELLKKYREMIRQHAEQYPDMSHIDDNTLHSFFDNQIPKLKMEIANTTVPIVHTDSSINSTQDETNKVSSQKNL